MMHRLISIALLCLSLGINASAQDKAAEDEIAKLRTYSLELWPKFRDTKQQFYGYVREAAEMRAYLSICKRHVLVVNVEPITQLATEYLNQIIPAHYEEAEWQKIEAKSKDEQIRIISDFSNDVMGFEYGYTLAEMRRKVKDSGKSEKLYCESIQHEFFQKHIALVATAKRQQEE